MNQRDVSQATQRLALNALVFLYSKILNRPLSLNLQFVNSQRPKNSLWFYPRMKFAGFCWLYRKGFIACAISLWQRAAVDGGGALAGAGY